ncbi:hypothetical protein RvY_03669 [Ramazzottius varieornatus]|uniref:Uncharacterized protein n=1 Tax=Ramazzottius varieornatus TaxID=947166 RepID=A0A1D1UPN9_RAMVA|nr:hypothetical protein RvY_03669 [Ramazzottius varieornatus]
MNQGIHYVGNMPATGYRTELKKLKYRTKTGCPNSRDVSQSSWPCYGLDRLSVEVQSSGSFQTVSRTAIADDCGCLANSICMSERPRGLK